jgi:RNA recognition motif-containing protein
MKSRTLYLSALPFRTDDRSVRALVEPYGKVHSLELYADWVNPTHEPYALVRMENIDEAARALDGRRIGNAYLRAHERFPEESGR